MVTRREIELFVRKHPSSTFNDLTISTGATTGCGRCRSLTEKQFDHFKRKQKDTKQLSIDF
jgi:bacterioferritin-associated ferredoxin